MRALIAAALFFAAIYFPTLTKLSTALVSPYAKADARKRLLAAAVDLTAVGASWLTYWTSGSIALLLVGASYLIARDAIRGQSVGKLLLGLVVIDVATGRPCGLKGSLWRNALFLVPGANVVAVVLEAITTLRDPQGQRLGDRVAQTQVVEGFGVRDLAASFMQWWRGVVNEVEPGVRKPGRDRVTGRRAAAHRPYTAPTPRRAGRSRGRTPTAGGATQAAESTPAASAPNRSVRSGCCMPSTP
jgi:RDD family